MGAEVGVPVRRRLDARNGQVSDRDACGWNLKVAELDEVRDVRELSERTVAGRVVENLIATGPPLLDFRPVVAARGCGVA
jgi:hypothetical protein